MAADDIDPISDPSALTGEEIMEAIRQGQLPGASMAESMGMRILEVSKGRVVFEGTPTLQHYNPMGAVHGGWFGVMLDSAMGCAVMAALPAGQGYTTLEYKVNLVRAAHADTGPLLATGTAVHVGRRTATAEGRIESPEGKLFATATTTCLVIPR